MGNDSTIQQTNKKKAFVFSVELLGFRTKPQTQLRLALTESWTQNYRRPEDLIKKMWTLNLDLCQNWGTQS